MPCPCCRLADLPTDTGTCVVCGHVVSGTAAAAPVPDATVAAATELEARRELANAFRLDALLAQGPSAAVYLACDKAARPVVLTAVARGPEPEAGHRFRSAAEAAGALDHRHIASLCGWGETLHFLWYSRQHVEGRTVAEILNADGPLELAACQRLLEQLGGALDCAHQLGVCHGDLNPARVIVDATGATRVTDFAVAAALAGREAAPEADQQAFAALVYECLSGAAPPARAAAALRAVRPEVPVSLSDALERALRERRAERFPSVREFVAAAGGAASVLHTRWLAQPPRHSPSNQPVILDFDSEPRRVSLGMAVGAVVLAAALGGLWFATATARGERSEATAARARASDTTNGDRSATLLSVPPVPSAPRASPSVLASPAAPTGPLAAPAPPAPPAPPAAGSAPSARVTAPTLRAPRPMRQPVAAPPRASQPGHLSINALPWGTVSVDGRAVGHTPLIGLAVAPGPHRVRVERDGFEPEERTVRLAPGETVRITDIVLRERAP